MEYSWSNSNSFGRFRITVDLFKTSQRIKHNFEPAWTILELDELNKTFMIDFCNLGPFWTG